MVSLDNIHFFCDSIGVDVKKKRVKRRRVKLRFKGFGLAVGLCVVAFLVGTLMVLPVVNRKSEIVGSDLSGVNVLGDEPFSNTDVLGYELLDDNAVFHMWNSFDSYYFNTSNGMQFSNHYEEYWCKNVFLLGYYSGDTWNLIFRTDNLEGFSRSVDAVTNSYINATLWKDLSYGVYDFRLAIRYHIKPFDSDLTIIPYIKNLDIAIPFDIGFGWEMKDIKINNNIWQDQININETTYLLNQTLDKKYTNITKTIFEYNETTNTTTNYTVKDGFFSLENINNVTSNVDYDLYLKWNPNLDYLVWVKSRVSQYNAPVTLFIKVGTLDADQEKSTEMFWHDSDTLYERYNTNNDALTEVYGALWRAQTFTIGNTGTNENHDITSIKILVKKDYGAEGIVTVAIRATDAGLPTGSDLTSGTFEISTLDYLSSAWKEIIVTPYELLASTMYAIVVSNPSEDVNGALDWQRDGSSSTYGGGQRISSVNSGSTWPYEYSTQDFMFEEYGITGAANTAPTFSGESPTNNSVDIALTPECYVVCNDADGADTLTVDFYDNTTGGWVWRSGNTTIPPATNVSFTYNQASSYNTEYWWKVNSNDGTDNISEIYSFTTLSNTAPTFSGHSPINGSTGHSITPSTVVYIIVTDADAEATTCDFYTSSDGNSWTWRQTNTTVASGTNISYIYGDASSYNTKYYWKVTAYDNTDNSTSEHYDFTTETAPESLSPEIVINFAGNLSDEGGPYYRPPSESVGLSGVFADGYYTNDSYQSENWIYINCSITDIGSNGMDDTNVWVNWLNGTTWTNWTYQLINTSNGFYEFNTSGNITTYPNYDYSFNVIANDTIGNSNWSGWNKTGINSNIVRRYVQLNHSTTNITYSYGPFYLVNHTTNSGIYGASDTIKKDRLHHDQGADGTTYDTGYMEHTLPDDAVETLYCASFLGYWFDDNICIESFNLDNIYFHTWYSSNNNELDVVTGNVSRSSLGNYYPFNVLMFKDEDSRSNFSIYGTGATNNNFFLGTGKLNWDPATQITWFTDNNIYELAMHFRESAPAVINNRSFTSFVLLNVPDNSTLNATGDGDTDDDGLSDWNELYITFTNPFVSDTDNDGYNDYDEEQNNSDPNNYTDVPAPPSEKWNTEFWWDFGYSNVSSYSIPFYWDFSYSNISSYKQSFWWDFEYSNVASYKQPFWWDFSYNNISSINTKFWWNFSYSNISSWNIEYYWNFSYSNEAQYHSEVFWDFSYSNIANYNQPFCWDFSYSNISSWNIEYYWNFSYSHTNQSQDAYWWDFSYSNSTPVTYIIISSIFPGNNSNAIPLQPNVYATIEHIYGDTMNVSIYYGDSLNASNTLLETFTNITNSTQTTLFYTASTRSTSYYWRINADDGDTETNTTLTFKSVYHDAAGFYPVNSYAYSLIGLIGLVGVIALIKRKKKDNNDDKDDGGQSDY